MWLDAEKALAMGAKSLRMGGMVIERLTPDEIRKQIDFWRREVTVLESQILRKGSVRVVRAMPRDL